MLLREVMTPQVETIETEDSVQEAAARMRDLDIGMLPVAGDSGFEGVLTDRDIVVRGMAAQRDPAQTMVSQVMTEQALSMPGDTPVSEAMSSMEQKQIRRLLVVDESEALIGVLSLGDLAVRAGDQMGGRVLEKVSDPTQPDRVPPRQQGE